VPGQLRPSGDPVSKRSGAPLVSLATVMGPPGCHDLGTTWLRGEHGGEGPLVSMREPA